MTAGILSGAWLLLAFIYLIAGAPDQWFILAIGVSMFFAGVNIIVTAIKKAGDR